MDFPFPKTREGVLSSIVLSVVMFALYYLFAFSFLLSVYDTQFWEQPFLYNDEVAKGSCVDLVTYVRIPKYVYSNGRQWVYVSFFNKSNRTIKDVYAQFVILEKNPSESVLLLPSFFSDNLLNDYVSINAIQPNVVLSGRFNVSTYSGFSVNNTRLKISCNSIEGEAKKPTSTVFIDENQVEALLHSVLENLLLPPWANGIVPAFAVLSSWLFEEESKKDKRLSRKENQGKLVVDRENVENLRTDDRRSYSELSVISESWAFLSNVCRIIWCGFLFNLFVWSIFAVSVQGTSYFISIITLFIVVPIICKFSGIKNFVKNSYSFISAWQRKQAKIVLKKNSNDKKIRNNTRKKSVTSKDKKKRVVRAGFFRRHDQNMAKKIYEDIEKARAQNTEEECLLSWHEQLRDYKYGENSKFWHWINKLRDSSPEIQELKKYIDQRTPAVITERKAKEREVEKRQNMPKPKKNNKPIKPVIKQEQDDAQLPVEVNADGVDDSKNEGAQSGLPIVEENKVNGQPKQEDLTPSDVTQQNE